MCLRGNLFYLPSTAQTRGSRGLKIWTYNRVLALTGDQKIFHRPPSIVNSSIKDTQSMGLMQELQNRNIDTGSILFLWWKQTSKSTESLFDNVFSMLWMCSLLFVHKEINGMKKINIQICRTLITIDLPYMLGIRQFFCHMCSGCHNCSNT